MPVDPVALYDWIQRAVMAAIIVAFMMGWLVPRYMYNEKKADNEKLMGKVDELQKALTEALKLEAERARRRGGNGGRGGK